MVLKTKRRLKNIKLTKKNIKSKVKLDSQLEASLLRIKFHFTFVVFWLALYFLVFFSFSAPSHFMHSFLRRYFLIIQICYIYTSRTDKRSYSQSKLTMDTGHLKHVLQTKALFIYMNSISGSLLLLNSVVLQFTQIYMLCRPLCIVFLSEYIYITIKIRLSTSSLLCNINNNNNSLFVPQIKLKYLYMMYFTENRKQGTQNNYMKLNWLGAD